MTATKDGARSAERRLVARLAELLEPREEILEAYLFGSHARGQAQPHSDVDVAVCVDDARADDTGYGYRANLTTDLMVGLGFNDVDVVVLNRAPPLLYHRALRDGMRLLARDLCATTTREGRAVSRYCDFVPQLAKMEAARRSVAARGLRPVSPGRADSTVVRRHLAALREALAHLRRHSGATREMLRADMDLRWTVEHGLQLCAQNAIDIATHLATAAGLDAPDYASAIDRLTDTRVLPAAFGARFRRIAGFRNVLVHDYIEVDLDVVARVLDENLDDFEEFARRVERHLDESHPR